MTFDIIHIVVVAGCCCCCVFCELSLLLARSNAEASAVDVDDDVMPCFSRDDTLFSEAGEAIELFWNPVELSTAISSCRPFES